MTNMANVSKSIAEEIFLERERQMKKEGFSRKHDDQYQDGQLERAAGCYAAAAGGISTNFIYTVWPWGWNWWKMGTKRRCLVKAGALIIAAIEKLDRDGMLGKDNT